MLTEKDDPQGYLLLQSLRAYVEMVMYENLEVHTSETIAAGEAAVEQFGALINVCHNELPLFDECESNIHYLAIHQRL